MTRSKPESAVLGVLMNTEGRKLGSASKIRHSNTMEAMNPIRNSAALAVIPPHPCQGYAMN